MTSESKRNSDERAPLLRKTQHGDEDEARSEKYSGASFYGCVFNLTCTIVGSGIMSLPATLKLLGLIPGVVLIILVSFIIQASVELLLRFSKEGSAVSYGDVMAHAYGRIGKSVLQITIVIYSTGSLIVYMIIIEDVLSGSTSLHGVHHTGILEGWFGEHWWTGRAFVLVAVTVIIFFPLMFFERIVHTIQNELGDSSQMQAVVHSSLSLCAVVYVMTGIFGFLLFGESTISDLLSNFDTDLGIPYSWLFNDIIRISYAAHVILVFPTIFLPLRLNLDGLLFPTARPLTLDKKRFVLESIGLVFISLVGAIFIPNIWVAFEFSGATLGGLLAFVFPASITLKDPHCIATTKDKIVSVSMIVLAVFANLMAIYSNLSSLLS
ncbi:amino acid transporter AVT6A isoform X2 [Rosa chinensis]|uniref:amino acid transporter AVT6A isoform X2 n=1 Tax=Rosa chinensis TaxID=74649 RepID=UPI001AD8ABE1|nr:amino acid transporter AVT6A isoform X2 [Rosa chinensis]